MKIEIWSKNNCPACDKAIYAASQMELATTEVYKYEADFSRERLFEEFPTAKTFPQIKVDGAAIGGWDEFNKLYVEIIGSE
jgi:glutaredoxin 3